MAATKLNPAAPPFPYPFHLGPPAPPPFPLADAACPPQFPFVTYCCVAAPPPASHIGFYFPVNSPPSPPSPAVLKGGAPAAAVHGRPPHKLMRPFSAGLSGAGKHHRQAAPLKPWQRQQPAPAAAAPAMAPAGPPRKQRLARRKAERSVAMAKPKPKPQPKAMTTPKAMTKAKGPRPRKAAGPRARRAAQAQRWSSPAPAPEPTYTTLRMPGPLEEAAFGENATTVMLRNIPNKLRSGDMISLLDAHCKRMNSGDVVVVSAYDALYLPMDFRRGYNFGYAFINFTTPEAAHRLYYDLEGCGWSVHGSKKTIRIVQAKIQGSVAMARHYRQQKLECDDEEFLPAIFSPPRDGVTAGSVAQRIRRIARRHTTATKKTTPASSPPPAPGTPPKAWA